jgi:hypothetical protein
LQAIQLGVGPNDAQAPTYLVRDENGDPIAYGNIGSWSLSHDDRVVRHLAGEPVVLEAGEYTVYAWRQSYEDTNLTPPDSACSSAVTISSLHDLRLEAAFARDGACELRSPTFDESLF